MKSRAIARSNYYKVRELFFKSRWMKIHLNLTVLPEIGDQKNPGHSIKMKRKHARKKKRRGKMKGKRLPFPKEL